jgi:hypothetical protein
MLVLVLELVLVLDETVFNDAKQQLIYLLEEGSDNNIIKKTEFEAMHP